MLSYAIPLLLVTIVAAVIGFSGIAAGAASIGKALFFVFLGLLIVSLILDGKPKE